MENLQHQRHLRAANSQDILNKSVRSFDKLANNSTSPRPLARYERSLAGLGHFDDGVSVAYRVKSTQFTRKTAVSVDIETGRPRQLTIARRKKSFLRMLGHEVFRGITGAENVVIDAVACCSIATSCGSARHAEHERARLALRRACLASNRAACSFSGTSAPVAKYISSGV